MKKILSSLVLFAPAIALAQWDPGFGQTESGLNGSTDLGQVIVTIIQYGLGIISGVAVLMFIVAGFMFIFGAGNNDLHTKAKGILTWGIVGLVVAVIGYTITYLVDTLFVQS